MIKRIIYWMMLTILWIGILTFAFNFQPVKSEPVTITVVGPWTGMELDAFMPVLQAFENKTGINVNYTLYNAVELATLLPVQFAAGTAPGDVIFMWSWFIEEKAEEGHILNVTGLIDEGNFSAGTLEPVKVGDTLYGGAYTGKVKPGFWYRKPFFETHNLTLPANWTEFTTLLDDIAGISGIVNPIVSGDGVGWPLSDVAEHFLITFGGPRLHKNLTAGKVAWNSSEVRSIFADKLVPLLQGNFSDPTEWTAALDSWLDGDYGLYFMGSWITGMVDNATDLGVFSLPGNKGLVFGADYFFIPAYTNYLEEAKQLFQFLAGAEAQTLQVEQGGHIATNLGVPLDAYPAVDRMVANLTVGKELLTDLDDTIGGVFQTTFWSQMKLLWVDPAALDDVLDALQAVAPPGSWTVDDDGPADFHTIQEAINAASSRDIILVASGIYYENIVVNKSVSLIGENRISTVVDGNGTGTVFTITQNHVNVTGFTTQNNVTYPHAGIVLDNVNHCNITKNNIANNEYGVRLYESSNNTISKNNIKSNKYGFSLGLSSNNTLSGNDIVNNTLVGILLSNSSNNNIYGNNMTNNYYGVHLGHSSSNKFYHNNFVDNTWAQAYIVASGYANLWDNGYPPGGNYWSDYAGVDVKSGPYQNETGSDGIGDMSYIVDVNNTDTYPLMGSFGPLTMKGENITVLPTDDVGLIFENVTAEGSTTVNRTETGPEVPLGFKLADQYYEIETTAGYSGKITIRIIYDDSNMTLEEEESLQLMQWNEATQEWIDITTFLDMENNIIYGETSHLSIFGVTSQHIPGDINGDGIVDIFDAIMLAGAYGSTPGSPNWNPEADINGDNIVDIFDAIILAGNYGRQ